MKRLFFIFFLLTFQTILGQKWDFISFETKYKTFSVDNHTDTFVEESKEDINFYTYFWLNAQKDTIDLMQTAHQPKMVKKDFFDFRLILKTAENTAQLLVWDRIHTDTISFLFSNQQKSIQIGENNYVLDGTYFDFLQKKVLKERNILELLDFLEDKLGDYFLPKPFFLISSKSQYQNNFRIKTAEVKLFNSVSDTTETFHLLYEYDEKGLVFEKTEHSDNEYSFEKRRKHFDNEKIIFEIEKTTYKNHIKVIKEIYFSSEKQKQTTENLQIGLNRTTFISEEVGR